ncbi:Spore coat protein CotF [Alkalithermobacter thermoalcaliphilus JW-YL-7 = DSM 7308]|uniref:Rubrerythrin n=1 Tax=Alkalithermobacter thermoalcaliphilus JW-YL-7 = DSM 7308 TaxID=1121328 RepID=A0A150FS82_CLOPD|nr:Rubrerythrin [[Clostridium] paradoxum JW-YL-7 = DSM 7308]SHK78527.1 Spore coat protein CotF [[Clostridium] paradoxum JW-YL-7 = DSM 7308]
MIQLSQKEKMMLQDQKHHEEMCIQKYTEYANKAQDPQLKQLFMYHADQERQHLNTINQILNGQVPNMQQNQQSQSNAQFIFDQSLNYSQDDIKFCEDLLMTEKYVSSTYNTTIFECVDTNVRKALNHIQKEEQEHGEHIFNYLKSKNMYNVQ